jgi:hypothetical protein
MKSNPVLVLFSVILALVLFNLCLSAIVTAQSESATVTFTAPETHPELNQPFTVSVNVTSQNNPVGSIRLAWNNTNLQLTSFPGASIYSTDGLNFTLTFVANSTEPADLRIIAYLNESFVYDAPWVSSLNSVQTGVE